MHLSAVLDGGDEAGKREHGCAALLRGRGVHGDRLAAEDPLPHVPQALREGGKGGVQWEVLVQAREGGLGASEREKRGRGLGRGAAEVQVEAHEGEVHLRARLRRGPRKGEEEGEWGCDQGPAPLLAPRPRSEKRTPGQSWWEAA